MGSPWAHLGSFANAFLCHFNKKWLSVCPVKLLPNVYKGYFDGIFVTFSSYSQLLKFVDYMNHQHPYIKFTSVVEKTKTSHFYVKPTFSGVFTTFDSFKPMILLIFVLRSFLINFILPKKIIKRLRKSNY